MMLPGFVMAKRVNLFEGFLKGLQIAVAPNTGMNAVIDRLNYGDERTIVRARPHGFDFVGDGVGEAQREQNVVDWPVVSADANFGAGREEGHPVLKRVEISGEG